MFHVLLPQYNINTVPFDSNDSIENILNKTKELKNIKMIFVETPCNPLIKLTSIKEMAKLKNEFLKNGHPDILLAIDNTLCGPLFLKPLELGADLVYILLLNLLEDIQI